MGVIGIALLRGWRKNSNEHTNGTSSVYKILNRLLTIWIYNKQEIGDTMKAILFSNTRTIDLRSYASN